MREAPNLKHMMRGIHTINGGSHPLTVLYIHGNRSLITYSTCDNYNKDGDQSWSRLFNGNSNEGYCWPQRWWGCFRSVHAPIPSAMRTNYLYQTSITITKEAPETSVELCQREHHGRRAAIQWGQCNSDLYTYILNWHLRVLSAIHVCRAHGVLHECAVCVTPWMMCMSASSCQLSSCVVAIVWDPCTAHCV